MGLGEQLIAPGPPAGEPAGAVEVRSTLRLALRAFRRDRFAVAGAVFMGIVIVAAVAAPIISPYSPLVGSNHLDAPMFSPGHLLGTDDQGRDILSRIIWGGRSTLPTAVIPVIVASAVSLLLGSLAGFYQGWLGNLIMRVLDVFFAVPMVLLGVAIAGILGAGPLNVMISMTVVMVPFITRVIYTDAALMRRSEFVQAAVVCGSSPFKILLEQVVPNVLPGLIVYATTNMGAMVVFAAGFSFLGLGVQPPTPDWGLMAADGRSSLMVAPQIAAIPGVVIILVAVAFNFVGDGLRDALDPRRRTA